MGEVYLVVADWPQERLTRIGRLSHWLKPGIKFTHAGLRFTGLRDEHRAALRAPGIWRPDAMPLGPQTTDVSWDYQVTRQPHFQRYDGEYYAGYKVREEHELKVDFERLFELCLRLTRAQPINHNIYRYDALFEVLPFRVYWECLARPARSPELGEFSRVAPSTCVALVLRTIAAARIDDDSPVEDDGAAFAALGLPRARWCLGRRYLTQFTVGGAVRALRRRKIFRVSGGTDLPLMLFR